MGESLDAWVDREAADLRENMQVNIETLLEGYDVSEEDKESLLRFQLMMVRQWATRS